VIILCCLDTNAVTKAQGSQCGQFSLHGVWNSTFYLPNGEHLATQFSCEMHKKYAGIEDSLGGPNARLYGGMKACGTYLILPASRNRHGGTVGWGDAEGTANGPGKLDTIRLTPQAHSAEGTVNSQRRDVS